jgi:hypothetical protein
VAEPPADAFAAAVHRDSLRVVAATDEHLCSTEAGFCAGRRLVYTACRPPCAGGTDWTFVTSLVDRGAVDTAYPSVALAAARETLFLLATPLAEAAPVSPSRHLDWRYKVGE